MSRFVISFPVTAVHQPKELGKAVPLHLKPSIGMFTHQFQGEREADGGSDGTWAQENTRTSLSTRLTEDKHAALEKVESCPYYGNNDTRIHGVPSMCKRLF